VAAEINICTSINGCSVLVIHILAQSLVLTIVFMALMLLINYFSMQQFSLFTDKTIIVTFL